jgi:hypothetical protein
MYESDCFQISKSPLFSHLPFIPHLPSLYFLDPPLSLTFRRCCYWVLSFVYLPVPRNLFFPCILSSLIKFLLSLCFHSASTLHSRRPPISAQSLQRSLLSWKWSRFSFSYVILALLYLPTFPLARSRRFLAGKLRDVINCGVMRGFMGICGKIGRLYCGKLGKLSISHAHHTCSSLILTVQFNVTSSTKLSQTHSSDMRAPIHTLEYTIKAKLSALLSLDVV